LTHATRDSYHPTRLHQTLAILFFLFYSYRHHRALHSFPTRRSSDLLRLMRLIASARVLGLSRSMPRTALMTVRTPSARTPRMDRSEEHTSELQSRFDLVCRLLLEKKKKKIEELGDYQEDEHERYANG